VQEDNLVVQIEPIEVKSYEESIKNSVPQADVMIMNSFSGAEFITVLIGAAPFLISKVLEFYIKHKNSARSASIKIGKDSIELSGMSIDQIENLAKSKTLEDLQNRLGEFR